MSASGTDRPSPLPQRRRQELEGHLTRRKGPWGLPTVTEFDPKQPFVGHLTTAEAVGSTGVLRRSADAFPGAQSRDLYFREAGFRQHLVGMRAKLRRWIAQARR